ncbi:3-thiaglutamate biosynthesis pearlin carrier peptide TglA [Pseudomonas haemolytica]|uniref:Uncharacterized protein n=1 Tax=Pseudomonas haemolytica TaxID=2600065 RepID=A0ABS1GRB8_9PSED|nr:TglA family RiPP precursor [Pseudomonas haemolytica]MBJ2244535.1 hypothetical protein [Pseudomonas haemolytica]MBJ2271611.1 hypothetical protein [Pseudomonas haemolytica]MBK3447770.1 hypothetical protein [Pseudomonas haemolytica]MBK3459520.1 hypothetical protein [Pseudomonas haemolytica]
MTQSPTTPIVNNDLPVENASVPAPQATEEALFEEFDLDDIEVIESKVFA